MAPHLAHPLRFLLPIFEGGRVGFFKMGLGMWLYDALSLFQAPELHEKLSRSKTLERVSSLEAKGLQGSYVYSDGYMDDDRLVFETLRSADRHGMQALNWAEARGPIRDQQNKVTGLKIFDHLGKKEILIRAQHIVSSVGPWTDELGSRLQTDWRQKLRPTKGVHLTFSLSRVPLPCAVVMAAEERIVFAIPRHEMVIVGTTDTDEKGAPQNVKTTEQDIQYLLGVMGRYFPGLKLQKKDIVSHYAGVRPLVADGSSSEGKTSREHSIWTENGVTYVAGGKYTTYRKMSEEVVDKALEQFPMEKRIQFRVGDSKSALNPRITEELYQQRSEVLEELSQILTDQPQRLSPFIDRFGHECLDFAKKWETEKWGQHRSVAQLEALIALHTTSCWNMDDFFRRRVPWFLSEKDHGFRYALDVGQVFADTLGWSQAELNQNIDNLKQQWIGYHSLTALETGA